MKYSVRNIAKLCKLDLGIVAGLKRQIKIHKRGKERSHFNSIYK